MNDTADAFRKRLVAGANALDKDARTIRAIETWFDGYRFRSRLEARWAAFFKHTGIKYRHEMEGYQWGDGERYLPDFWLPTLTAWVEVKPELPPNGEWLKVQRFAQADRARRRDEGWPEALYYIISGEPWYDAKGANYEIISVFGDRETRGKQAFLQCLVCKRIYIDLYDRMPHSYYCEHCDVIERPDRAAFDAAGCVMHKGDIDIVGNGNPFLTRVLASAYKTVRGTDFSRAGL